MSDLKGPGALNQEAEEVHAPDSRPDGRRPDELRPVRFQNHIAPHAAGSTLISWGHTQVICAATVEESVPRWMRDQGLQGGWVTAEYSMLPYATLERKTRDATRGRIDGRSQEIQRLIGRSLRAAVDLRRLGTRTIWVDCDVLQADGGTRTAAITGGFVAVALAVRRLLDRGLLKQSPIENSLAAVSVGVVDGRAALDLCYVEDAAAGVDMNLVMTGDGDFVEIQGSAEKSNFCRSQLEIMLKFGTEGIRRLIGHQSDALKA